jgi:cytochrome b involved in lipid metabolism
VSSIALGADYDQHKSPEDAWSVFNGKVYNITPYLPFHPGGVDEMMRVAGRDGTKLFSESSSLHVEVGRIVG